MNELIEKVENWARVRRLHTASPKAQALKVIEEFTETLKAYDDSDDEEIIDGVGDTYVTLIILCQQLDIDFKEIEEKSGAVPTTCHARGINRLATGVSKGNLDLVKRATLGLLNTANFMSEMVNKEPCECLQVAYNEIKDRKGMMIDGTFIKYDDLSDENKAALDNA